MKHMTESSCKKHSHNHNTHEQFDRIVQAKAQILYHFLLVMKFHTWTPKALSMWRITSQSLSCRRRSSKILFARSASVSRLLFFPPKQISTSAEINLKHLEIMKQRKQKVPTNKSTINVGKSWWTRKIPGTWMVVPRILKTNKKIQPIWPNSSVK